jgi:hypothetical protein
VPARLPRLVVVLAWIGMALGGFAGLFAASSAGPLLGSRDRFVADCREYASRLPSPLVQGKDRDLLERVIEREADVTYSRRGVALPLAATNAILSLLLLVGCARALRGEAWGASAWSLAALASLPYQLIDGAFAMVRARDLAAVLAPLDPELAAALGVYTPRLVVVKCGVAFVYFATCALVLRRPSIKRLFVDDAPDEA